MTTWCNDGLCPRFHPDAVDICDTCRRRALQAAARVPAPAKEVPVTRFEITFTRLVYIVVALVGVAAAWRHAWPHMTARAVAWDHNFRAVIEWLTERLT